MLMFCWWHVIVKLPRAPRQSTVLDAAGRPLVAWVTTSAESLLIQPALWFKRVTSADMEGVVGTRSRWKPSGDREERPAERVTHDSRGDRHVDSSAGCAHSPR